MDEEVEVEEVVVEDHHLIGQMRVDSEEMITIKVKEEMKMIKDKIIEEWEAVEGEAEVEDGVVEVEGLEVVVGIYLKLNLINFGKKWTFLNWEQIWLTQCIEDGTEVRICMTQIQN